MSSTIEELEARLAAKQGEVEQIERDLKMARAVAMLGAMPANLSELLMAGFREAAGKIAEPGDSEDSEWIDLAPGVRVAVTIDTDYPVDEAVGPSEDEDEDD